MTIITIDGPVGSGKSTAARLLARRTGYAYLDTGAMYRAIGWKAYTTGTGLNEEDLERLCDSTRFDIELTGEEYRVLIDGKDITAEIRTPDVSRMASIVSTFTPVRNHLVRLQRKIGLDWVSQYGGVIVEGRDIGTVVFPDAPVKFFLEADIVERGGRRWKELRDKGVEVGLDETIEEIMKRDENDKGRSLNPLKRAEDAVVIDTTGLSLEDVVEELLGIINQKSNDPLSWKIKSKK